MNLQDIRLKPAYDSDEDDILNDFYIPALSNSLSYWRLAGFFSSSALAVAARGILGLIKNGGTMKLVVGAKLRKADVEAIEKGMKNREQAIAEMMIRDLDSIEAEFVKDHVKALAWMVANNKLEIKVAVPLNTYAKTAEDINEGIYHQKVGILSGGNNTSNSISFSGSVNESETGWLRSIEEFKVFRGWVPGEDTYVKSDIEKFEKYWNGLAKRAIVIDIPTAVRDKLIELAPERVDELHLERHYRISGDKKLWPHQVEAIQAWVKNGFKGILAMATGSGKTLAALSACALAPSSVITIILVPTEPILDQWARKEISKFDPSGRVIICSGSHPEWKTLLPLELGLIRKAWRDYSPTNRLYVTAIMNTAASEKFLLAWKGIPAENVQIICDEVHHVGAPFFQNCMTLPSSRRIGLSATPERNWDPIGTRRIIEYFGPTIYEYGIKSAIQDGHLCHYKYYPYFAFLNKQEFEEFQKLSDEIEKEIARISTKEQEKDSLAITRKLERLLEDRARIKKKAKDKIRVFREILSRTDIRPLIVFCEDHEQLNEIKSVLKEKGVSNYLIYTSRMTDWQRKHVLDDFRKREADILLAIRCLDEGLDVPECEGCIIVASSSSTREFIQRRGRILRGLKGKSAILNDIIVVPCESIGQEDMKAAKTLVRQELERVKELAEASDNEWETRNIIRKELAKYGLEFLADI